MAGSESFLTCSRTNRLLPSGLTDPLHKPDQYAQAFDNLAIVTPMTDEQMKFISRETRSGLFVVIFRQKYPRL